MSLPLPLLATDRADLVGPRPQGTLLSDPRIGVVIADGNEVYREVLGRVIESLPGLELLGSVSSGCQALVTVAARRPDLLLLDLQLPDINGLQTLALIRQCHPATRVIIMAGDDAQEVRATCMAQGADAFVSKRRLHNELRRGVAEACHDLGIH